MKAQTATVSAYYSSKAPGAHRYPNSASRRYFLEKVVDGVLAAVITLGVVVSIIVVLTM